MENDIILYNQIEMKASPTEDNHIITKRYLDSQLANSTIVGGSGSYIGQSFPTYADLSTWFLSLDAEQISKIHNNDFTFVNRDENYDDQSTLYIFTNTDSNLSIAFVRVVQDEQKPPISNFELEKMFIKGYLISYKESLYEVLVDFTSGNTTLEDEFKSSIEVGNLRIISGGAGDISMITNEEIDEMFAEIFKRSKEELP